MFKSTTLKPAKLAKPSKLALITELRTNNIFQTLDKPITLKSGRQSTFYADFRKLYTNPTLLSHIATQLTPLIPSSTNYLAGSPLGAIPITTIISQKLNLPFLLVRPQAKSHGTKRLVEGEIDPPSANITIIEDVITTGQSTLETYQKLRATYPAANITTVVAIFNRQELHSSFPPAIDVRSLLTLSQVTLPSPHAQLLRSSKRLLTHYLNNKPSSPHAQKLLNTLAKKSSNLIFSADLTTTAQLLLTLNQVAPHIAAVKLHTDTLKDPITQLFINKLKAIAKEHDLLIIEDRKFTDIGSTLANQLTSHLNIADWADAVTVFPCVTKTGLEIINSHNLSPLIIEQLSSYKTHDDNPYLSDYEKSLLAPYHSFQVHKLLTSPKPDYLGTIGQTNTPKWQFTPGVSLTKSSDSLNQNYVTPEQAAKQGADFFIVGRSIYETSNPAETAKLYKEACWKAKLDTL